MEIALLVIFFAVLTLFSKELGDKVKAIWERPFLRHTLLMLIIAMLAFSNQSLMVGTFNLLVLSYVRGVSFIRGLMGEGTVAGLCAQSLMLFLIPTILTVIVGAPLYYFRRKYLGYAIYVLWGSWLVLGSLLMMAGP